MITVVSLLSTLFLQAFASSNQIVLNLDNCKRDNDLLSTTGSMLDNLIDSLDAKSMFVCIPQGDLKQIVEGHNTLVSADPSSYMITTTNVGYSSNETKIVIYLTDRFYNIGYGVSQGQYTLKFDGRRAPCHQEISLACGGGRVDACFTESGAEFHKCVEGTISI